MQPCAHTCLLTSYNMVLYIVLSKKHLQNILIIYITCIFIFPYPTKSNKKASKYFIIPTKLQKENKQASGWRDESTKTFQ